MLRRPAGPFGTFLPRRKGHNKHGPGVRSAPEGIKKALHCCRAFFKWRPLGESPFASRQRRKIHSPLRAQTAGFCSHFTPSPSLPLRHGPGVRSAPEGIKKALHCCRAFFKWRPLGEARSSLRPRGHKKTTSSDVVSNGAL